MNDRNYLIAETGRLKTEIKDLREANTRLVQQIENHQQEIDRLKDELFAGYTGYR